MTFGNIVVNIAGEVAKYFLLLISSLTVVVFVIGVTKYIYKGDSQEERKKGRNLMVWGLIGIFVMFAVFGLVAFLGDTFGINTAIPQFRGQSIPIDR